MNKTLRAAAIALIAVAATAGPAPASSDFTLELAAPPAVVGQPLVLHAAGTIPTDEIQYPYWFSLAAIPSSVTTSCPADRWEGAQFALGTGGSVVVLSQRERPDVAGAFTIPVAITPTAPGSVLLCGYTDDGMTNTLASASLLMDIAPRPWVQLRWDIRACRALLGQGGSRRCVRGAARRARAGCRRDAVCLRKVRRVARSAS
jgi:hypothetical protein